MDSDAEQTQPFTSAQTQLCSSTHGDIDEMNSLTPNGKTWTLKPSPQKEEEEQKEQHY